MGAAYLRYSFTKGTEQEVAFLVDALDLRPGMRVLDVGCGPGRHAYALAERRIEVVGVDISQRFVDLANENAPAGATFHRVDARALSFSGEFDVAISLCQGAFGLANDTGAAGANDTGAAGANDTGAAGANDADGDVLAGIARAIKPGGKVAFSAFSSYFLLRFLEDHDTFDAATGVNHERTEVKDAEGNPLEADLWTSCFTPRELRLLCTAAGLTVEHIWAVTPGAYARQAPDLDHPEYLTIALR
ncbi:MAG: class I SAM-dependent methyltransferase [Actinobacteria bacterium]|nr:class I SAM-dependent methyltransferase [Actinomycetota bacterium]